MAMTIVAGVFTFRSGADRAVDRLRGARVAADRINLLSPGDEESVADTVATVEAEPPGVGKAIGVW
jgi:hypothetical protein